MFLFYVNPILIAAAVIPAIVLLRFVYKEDRLDKESPGLLLSLCRHPELRTCRHTVRIPGNTVIRKTALLSRNQAKERNPA